MAEAKPTETKVAPQADHDRVSGLSVKADGTLDQNNPEVIGDKDAVIAATKRQFAEQAVAAVDAKHGPIVQTEDGGTEDKLIDARKAEHDKAAAAAEKQAEAVVNSLHKE